jgi:hypothetical protein
VDTNKPECLANETADHADGGSKRNLDNREARVERITFVEEKEFRKIKSFGLIRVIRGQISFPLYWCPLVFIRVVTRRFTCASTVRGIN